MKIITFFTALCLSTFAINAAEAEIIVENVAGTYTSSFSITSDQHTYYYGQSFTTPSDGVADYLDTISLLSASSVATGTGTLYLFSSAYTGTESGLSTATTNLLGTTTWNGTTSSWNLTSSNILLAAGTKYYFYFAPTTVISASHGSTSGSDFVNTYSGGEYYVAISTSSNFFALPTDFNFRVTGTAVPEPATYAGIFGVLALGFAAFKRRVKKA